MANIPIKPWELPAGTPIANASIVGGNGSIVEKYTPAQIVDVAIPLASQEDAESGTGNSNRMSALRTKQAIYTNTTTISPRRFGGNPISGFDNRQAIYDALVASSVLGIPVDGGSEVYQVSGTVDVVNVDGVSIRSLQVEQSGTGSGATLRFKDCDGLNVDRLVMTFPNHNTSGDMNNTFGLLVDGGSGHSLKNIEASGNGERSFITLWNASSSVLESPYVHDTVFNNSSATDDQSHGVWLSNCTDCTVSFPRIDNMTGNASLPFPTRFTRAIAFGGCVRCKVVVPTIADVDQGVDFTGSAGNIDCQVIGGTVYQACTHGVKFANSAVRCKAIGVTVNRAGISGYSASGPSESGLTNITQDCEFSDCTAIDIGWNAFPGFPVRAFQVIDGSADLNYPKNIKMRGCQAIDRQTVKTMEHGFYNGVDFDPSTPLALTQAINCTSEGAITAEFAGMQAIYCHVKGSGSQSFTSGAEAAIGWNTNVSDTTFMHDTASDTDEVLLRVAGQYRVRACVRWVAGGGTYRRIKLTLNGSTVTITAVAPVSGEQTTCFLDEIISSPANGVVRILGEQSSGGALAADLSQSYLIVERLGQV